MLTRFIVDWFTLCSFMCTCWFIFLQVQYDGCTYPRNSLFFAMHDGFYGALPEESSEVS